MIAFAAMVVTFFGIAAGLTLVILFSILLGPLFWVPYVGIYLYLRAFGLTLKGIRKTMDEPPSPPPFQVDGSLWNLDPSMFVDVSKMPRLGSRLPPPPPPLFAPALQGDSELDSDSEEAPSIFETGRRPEVSSLD